MSKELFIVIILFSIFILGIIITVILYNNRINKKVRNYINDKKGRPGVSIPPLIYVVGIFAICALCISTIVYLIPQRKLYDVEYVLYTHPASITIGLEKEEFSLERMMETVTYHAEEVSGSKNCSVYIKETDNKIVITTLDGEIIDIQMPNIVIAFNDLKNNKEDVTESNKSGYESNYVEYKEYKVNFDKETKKIKLDSVLYQSGESFIWGPENSNEFNLKVSLYYLDFNKKYQEFKETEEDVFEYQFILDSEE